ncbi:MAG: hypothetical protein QM682_14835 [Paracoccus sp. (in: a-proteobacteria)]|uniref:hypothetical protein n=1 Tax=Paracoccus sp. TaxID=267 RepID=UPI0039E3B42A
MPVSIYGEANRATFYGIQAAYFGGKEAELRDRGGNAVTSALVPVAPRVTREPTILPLDAAMGDSITLDLGEAVGQPAPAANWDFTLNGVSIKSLLDEGAMTMELSEPGIYALVVAWTNAADSTSANEITLSVIAPPAESIDYATQALAYLTSASTYSGTAQDVTSISPIGTGNYVFTKAGSGTAIQAGPTGFVFGDGAYVQTQVLSGQPTTDGLFVVADVTLTSYGTNLGQIIDGTGVNLKLRNSSGTIQALGPVAGQGSLNLGGVSYGNRVIVGGQLDDVLDLLSGVSTAGATVSAPHDGLTDPSPTRFTTGRYVHGTLHRLVIVGRPEGGDWPLTMDQVIADFRLGE